MALRDAWGLRSPPSDAEEDQEAGEDDDGGGGSCTVEVREFLTGLGPHFDHNPIEYPPSGGSAYIMPAFFRQQGADDRRTAPKAYMAAGGPLDLFVTTDITVVGSGKAQLSARDVMGVLSSSGSTSALQASLRPNGLTVEATGAWHEVFAGLARCHELAHARGSDGASGVHTTLSLRQLGPSP